MANILLTDSWIECGTNIVDFEGLVKKIDSMTKNIRVPLGDLQLHTYAGSLIGDPKINFIRQEPMCTTKTYLRTKALPQPKIQTMTKECFKKSLGAYRDELIEAGFILANAEENEKYIVSPYAVKTLCRRVNLGGKDYTKPTFIRDLNIATQMYYYSESVVTLVVRTDGDKKKIYAVMSDRYAPIRQNMITEIYNGFRGKYSNFICRKWEMTHMGTKIYLEFPELADEMLEDRMIPGIMIETSDCGEASFQALGTQRVGDHTFYTGSQFTLSHTADGTSGINEIENIVSKIEETIFSEYNKLPDRLKMLKEVPIDPAAIISVFEHKLRQAIGKKATLKLLDSDINTSDTAYRFCINLMKNPVTESMGATAVEKYRTFCRDAAYFNFEKGLSGCRA